MGFFDNLFEKKFDKPIADSATIERATSGGFRGAFGGYSSNSMAKWDWDHALNDAYRKVVWVFRAVHTIAANQAGLEIQMKDTKTPQGHVVDNPDFYRLVNKRPNPYYDAWTLRYRLSTQCLLSPMGAFMEIVPGKNGTPQELYILDPGTVEVVKDHKKFVKTYNVTRANGKVDELDPDRIIWVINIPDPADPYRNVTPLESVGVSVETDYFARLYNRNFLKNDGRPGMLVSVNGDLMAEDADELKHMFSGGYGGAGQTMVIEAEGLDVADFGTKPRDAQWSEALDSAKIAILDAFGVPESVMGNASGRCLRSTELVHLGNGQIKMAQELVGQEFDLVQPFDGTQRTIKAKAEYAKRENIYKITTFSGRSLEVNAEHPLFMALSREKKTASSYRSTKRDIFPYGWTALNEIKSSFDKNDRLQKGVYTEIAVPLWMDQFDSVEFDLDKAYDIGTTFEEVPDAIFESQLEAKKAFLSGVYTEHGRLSQHTGFDLYAPTREYAKRLQMLLTRVGVASYIGTKKMTHTVTISGFVNMRHFLDQIVLTGKQADNAAKVRERIDIKTDDARQEGLLRTDALPAGLVWDRVMDIEDLGEDDTVAISIDDAQHRHYMSVFWEHNTYNNADAESETFWSTTMRNHCDRLAQALEKLTGSDEDQTYLEFDFDSIDVLQAAKRRRLDRIRQDLNNGAITMNDYRIALGMDPVEEPYFRVYFFPNGAIGGKQEDIKAVMQQMTAMNQPPNPFDSANPFATNTATGGDGQIGGFNDQVQGELAASGGDHSQTVFDQAARTLRSSRVNNVPPDFANPRANSEIMNRVSNLVNKKVDRPEVVQEKESPNDIHSEIRSKTIGFIEGSLESWSNRQLNVVSDRLNHAKVRKGTRHWDGGIATKDLDLEYLVDVDEWTTDVADTITRGLKSTLHRMVNIRSNDLKDAGFKPKTGSEYVADAEIDEIVSEVRQQLEKSVAQQSKLIQKHIGVSDKSGMELKDIQETLEHPENFDRFNWIDLLAKRITTYAIESAYNKLYSNVDAKVTKKWHTHPQEAFRKSHSDLDGVKVAVNEAFNAKMQFPTDTLSSEGDNCACWLIYEAER